VTRRVLAIVLASSLLAPAFAAAASGRGVTGRVFATPQLVTITLSAGSVQVGVATRAEATVQNLGASPLNSIKVELRADHAGLVIGDPIRDVNSLKGGKSATLSWTVCGKAAGSYVLLARVTANGIAVDSLARVLVVVSGGKKACP